MERKRLAFGEFLNKVLIELPVPSASEMEQYHLMERHLGLSSQLESEVMALRWWYLSHLLFGQLTHRGHVPVVTALKLIGSFMEMRQAITAQLGLDFEMRCEFYERALQDDLDDEGHGYHLLDCFYKFVGRDNEMLRELFFMSMVGITARLAKALDRFEIVEA